MTHKILVTGFALISSFTVAAGGCPLLQEDLIISEYVEGSGNNKAIEIYNGTGALVDLTSYTLIRNTNGGTGGASSLSLSGSIADNDVFVVANNSANASLLALADQLTSSTVMTFNGDDTIELRNGALTIDSIGDLLGDPGSEWNAGGVGTQNETLRRNALTCGGDTNVNDPYDPSIEWSSFPQDTFDDLGVKTLGLLPVELMNFSVE